MPVIYDEDQLHELGEAAYNAYATSVGWVSISGERLPDWEAMTDRIREAWMKAADAVTAVAGMMATVVEMTTKRDKENTPETFTCTNEMFIAAAYYCDTGPHAGLWWVRTEGYYDPEMYKMMKEARRGHSEH